jgi:hypothetical protein
MRESTARLILSLCVQIKVTNESTIRQLLKMNLLASEKIFLVFRHGTQSPLIFETMSDAIKKIRTLFYVTGHISEEKMLQMRKILIK